MDAAARALMLAANNWLLTASGRRTAAGERLRAAAEALAGSELPPALERLRDRACAALGGGLPDTGLRDALLAFCAAAGEEAARARGARFVPAASWVARTADALGDEP